MDYEVFAGKRFNLETHNYIYTQSLSDGKTFIQALSICEDGSSQALCRNPSLEVYNDDRKFWINETMEQVYLLADRKAIPITKNDGVEEVLHTLPERIMEHEASLSED